MPFQLHDGLGTGFFGGTASNVDQLVYLQPEAVPQWPAYANNVRDSIRDPYAAGVLSTGAAPGTPPSGGDAPSFVTQTQHQDFHYRIWVTPVELSLRNPALGIDIPIQLWNTWPFPPTNTYVATALQDLTGVTADISPGDTLRSFQAGNVNLQLDSDAGLKMNGYVSFEFVQGVGLLHLTVERASIVPVIPDSPVREKWEWRSNVMVSEDGTEQRVSLTSAPRKTTDFVLTVIYPDEANAVIKQLFADSASAIVLPQYQYLAGLKVDALAGDTILSAPTNRGDLRAGSTVLIRTRQNGFELNTVDSVTDPDIIVLESPLQSDYPAGSWIVPAFATFLNRRTGFERAPADGFAVLATQAVDADIQAPFIRSGAAIILDTFNTLPLLDHRPIVRGSAVSATYDSGVNRLDYGGKITVVAPWSHTQVELGREYLVDRFFDPDIMDWWRTFLDYARGRTKPFYVPSYRPDLVALVTPVEGAGSILLADNRYSSGTYGSTVFDQLAIYTAAGVFYTNVVSVSTNEFDQDTAFISPPFPAGPEWVDIDKISFLMRCRLADDTVEWEHHQLHSYLSLGIRTSDQ